MRLHFAPPVFVEIDFVGDDQVYSGKHNDILSVSPHGAVGVLVGAGPYAQPCRRIPDPPEDPVSPPTGLGRKTELVRMDLMLRGDPRRDVAAPFFG